jgi:nucleoside-diphosphate-sugar epimerase
MRIAVTGGNGDLGRALVPFLIAQGHEVVSVDLALPPALVPGARHLVADVGDFGQLVGCLRDCEAAIHLAALRSPLHHPEHVVYAANTVGSYNLLSAAAALGIARVCLASSINATGAAFSRHPRFDYFPLDEGHPTYSEDPYSLSKWVLEQQADAFARRYDGLRIASLRFHWLLESEGRAREISRGSPFVWRHLWAYTNTAAAARACLRAVSAEFTGHERFYIVAPRTVVDEPSEELARRHFPDTPIRGALGGNAGFFSCARAEQVLGWRHDEE